MPVDSVPVLLGLLDDLESFDEFAFNRVDDIRGWRHAERAKLFNEYREKLPEDLAPELAYLCRWIRANTENIDPTPLEELYSVIATWLRRLDPDLLPPQPIIEITLDRTRIVIRSAIDAVIHTLDVADLPGGNRVRMVLAALYKSGAFDKATFLSTEEISPDITAGGADTLKLPVAALSKAGFIGTKKGRKGGLWLTGKGRRVARQIVRIDTF